MSSFKRKILIPALAAALLSGVFPASAHAQMPVIDPANLAQNLIQVVHMVEQIKNQVKELENQAKMLAKSDLRLAPELAQSIEEARALMRTAERLSFDATRVGGELETLYPETYDHYELEALMRQSDHWMAQSRESLKLAMTLEARAETSLAANQDRLTRALEASDKAEGATSAAQAGNQLLGINAAQLADIQALLASQGRALLSEKMERLAREERAKEIQRRAFPTERAGALAPARQAF